MSLLRNIIGKIFTGTGSVLSVHNPVGGIVTNSAGQVINTQHRGKGLTLYPEAQKLIDEVIGSPDYIKLFPQTEIPEPVLPVEDPGGGVLSGLNPLYLFAGALLIIVLLFKK